MANDKFRRDGKKTANFKKGELVMQDIAGKLIGLVVAVSLCLTVAAFGTNNTANVREAEATYETSALSLD